MEFGFLQANESTSDLSTYTFSSENLGTADAARYIICAVHGRLSGTPSITSVTIGGVTATAVLTPQSTSGSICGLFIASVPSGTTGDVEVVFGGTMLRAAIQLYRAVDIDSATASDTGTSSASDPTDSINVPAGGFAIGAANYAASATESWTGITEDDARQVEFLRCTSASDEFVSEQTGLTLLCDFTGVAATAVGVFASWGPGGGGGGANVNLLRGKVRGGLLLGGKL